MSQPPRLNIRRLPSQMVITSLTIWLVVLGGLAALSIGRADLVFVWIALGLLIVALRQLLLWPDEESARHRMAPAGAEFAPLQRRIEELAAHIGLPRSPRLLIAPGDYELQVFGTWRRWYIALDQQRAQGFLELTADQARVSQLDAALLHEIFHFQHRDNLWMEYTRSLLRNGVLLILWLIALLFGWFWLVILAQRSFFANYAPDQLSAIFNQILPGFGDDLVKTFFISPEEFEQVRDAMAQTNVGQSLLNAWFNLLPFLLVGSALLFAFWRRFMHLREIYADAGVAAQMGECQSLIASLTTAGRSADAAPLRVMTWIQRWGRRLRSRLFNARLGVLDRLRYLHHPEQIYGSAWRYGWLIGLFVNFLNLALLNSVAGVVLAQQPLHLPVIAAIILITLYLLVPLALGAYAQVWRNSLLLIGLYVGIYSALVLFVLALIVGWALVDPAMTIAIFNAAASSRVWYSGITNVPLIDDLWSVIAQATLINLLHIPTLALAIGAPLAALVALIRRMLTWYGFPQAERRLMRAVVALIILVTALVALVLLPPLTDLILLRGLSSLGSLWYWAGAALTLLCCGGFAGWWISQDRRYAGRCPGCGRPVPGAFALGRRCPHCGAALHPWLEVYYRVEATP